MRDEGIGGNVEMAEKLTTTKWEHVLRAEIDVNMTDPERNAPSLRACRFAVLPLYKAPDAEMMDWQQPAVIYDRLLNRIVDGAYFTTIDDVLHIAEAFNKHWERAYPDDPRMMRAPNGDALGLVYPGWDRASDDDEEE